VTTRRLQITLNEECAEVMRALRRRYETSQESVRIAIGIAGVIVDAWANGWPVLIRRPNGTYRVFEARNSDHSRRGRVLSAVRVVYVHDAEEGRVRP
jgi:hypothetical protein